MTLFFKVSEFQMALFKGIINMNKSNKKTTANLFMFKEFFVYHLCIPSLP